jgi:phosphoenolpyruvate carboxykinase (GTP)
MLPFCGYNMGDYCSHWLSMPGRTDEAKLPKIFFVNWFRKDRNGKFVWPGFGDNVRVLKWIFERLDGSADAVDTPIGRLPSRASLDLRGLDLREDQLDLLLSVDTEVWKEEAALIPPHYEKFGARMPKALWEEHADLTERLTNWTSVSVFKPRAGGANKQAAANG